MHVSVCEWVRVCVGVCRGDILEELTDPFQRSQNSREWSRWCRATIDAFFDDDDDEAMRKTCCWISSDS